MESQAPSEPHVSVSPHRQRREQRSLVAQSKRTVQGRLQVPAPGDQAWLRYRVYVERIALRDGVAL